jgi:predicted transcriptional regulator YdeE
MRVVKLALLAVCVSASAAVAQSVEPTPLLGCPDASPEEAAGVFQPYALNFPSPDQLPTASPGEIIFNGVPARLDAHKVAEFAHIGEAWQRFEEILPSMANKVMPEASILPDADIQGQDDETDLNVLTFALCFQGPGQDRDFSFMPAAQVDNVQGLRAGETAIVVPAQKYVVFNYEGLRSRIGDFRYALTSVYWPAQTSLVRANAPNIEIYGPDVTPTTDPVKMQLWVPVVQ